MTNCQVSKCQLAKCTLTKCLLTNCLSTKRLSVKCLLDNSFSQMYMDQMTAVHMSNRQMAVFDMSVHQYLSPNVCWPTDFRPRDVGPVCRSRSLGISDFTDRLTNFFTNFLRNGLVPVKLFLSSERAFSYLRYLLRKFFLRHFENAQILWNQHHRMHSLGSINWLHLCQKFCRG